ncbi:transcription initiation factor TFIID subunit 8 [Drosophila willistoni]|uniref:transcription initiation factor TFIID subunit 8 n=1 Tax=Drosophila willistoni TaxID=7260 RepID=UPI001F086CA7|nr:transcription initiation factor TFIID subunit 8 [Drosophila willistoni]
MKMNVYEKGLLEVIDYLLEERDGCLEDDLVGLAVQNVLKQFIYEVGVNGSEASDHASRGSMCFFDVEFALTHMDIEFDDLMELWEEEKTRKEPAIRISSPKTFDQDCHVGPVPMMGTVMEKDDRHIPDYMPEFPCIHTYQQTWIYDELERDDEDVRHRLAENSLYIQKAMNNYLVNSRPTTSLFLTPQSTKQYDLVLVEPSDKQRPAFFNALLPPRDSCNLHSIVEDDDYDDEDESSSSSDDDDDTDEGRFKDKPVSLIQRIMIMMKMTMSKCGVM